MENIFNKFTTHYKKSIVSAYGLSLAEKKAEIGIEEIFWGLVCQKGSLGQETLIKAGIKKTITNNEVKKNNLSLEKIIQSAEQIPLSTTVKKVIIESVALAGKYEHSYVGTEHLLYSLVKNNNGEINRILDRYKVNQKKLLKNMEIILNSTSKFADMTDAISSIKEKMKKEGKKNKRRADSVLEFFGVDLTDEVMQKNINPVIGRDKEINRMIQILSRKDKNNPILLGEPGVGKTAIAEGLAKKILEAQVPDILINKKIYALDMPLVVAGTSYRGEFEARIKQIIDEVKADKNIILFIDEIHNIMGAGSASGTMDAANILKPALAKGDIRCIGATTFDDYKKYIEPDNALSRRMQKVIIAEPTGEESIEILKGIKESYEKHHLIEITDEAIEEAVNLSIRYMTNQFLPDKAIDLVDEAASKKRINRPQNINLKKINELKKELNELADKKNLLVAQSKYNEALRLKSKEIELISQIYKIEEEEIKNKMKISQKTDKTKVMAEDIRKIVAEATKINIPETKKSNQIIKELTNNLEKYIIGQGKVIEELANNLKRSVAGLSGEKRPLGSFIFTGPSGVGKTYTAKVLGELISPNGEGLVKLDMSEFGEKFNASKLIGAPAGYVGYDDGGQLTEKIKRNPYAVILLDEIEKAHPDIFNLFLQILEDGYLTDSKGRQVNFRNTIIIMTTNVGLKKSAEKENWGFGEDNKEKLKNIFKEKLSEWMRPELLNRIDQILVFNELTQDNLRQIIELELENINKNLIARNLSIKWNKTAANYLLKNCADKDRGARVIREVLRNKVENPLAEKIINNPGKKAIINIEAKNGQLIFK